MFSLVEGHWTGGMRGCEGYGAVVWGLEVG